MAFKIGDKYKCTETTVDYWTVSKEYPVQLRTGTNPCIVDDEGIGWYQDTYEMYATFKLNEEEKEMKFKKDDIVEVINEDKWQGIYYPVGTQLRVCEDQAYDSVVSIYDSMQKQGGYAKLWEWNLKLIKREEEEVEDTPDQKATKEEPTIYTKTEVIRQIAKAYQQFDNDPQRLAYLKGYFAK